MKSINAHCHVVRYHLIPALCAIFLLVGCGGGGGGSPSDSTPPTDPTALTATPLSSSSVALAWTGSTDDSGVVVYEVYRDGSKVASITQTQFDDVNLLPSTTYAYDVLAIDPSANASMSVSASAKTLDSVYRVWGVRQFSPDCNYYNPDDPVACAGLDLLGAESTMATFTGTYDQYVITAAKPDHPQVDAVQFSDGTYAAVPTTGNTQDPQNMAGAPDGNYAVVGLNTGCSPDPFFGCYLGGYAVVNPTGTMTSVTVVVIAP